MKNVLRIVKKWLDVWFLLDQQKKSLDFLYWLFSSEKGKNFVTNELDFITPFNSFTEDELPTDPLAREVVRYMNDDNLTTVPWIFTSFPSEVFKTEVGGALLGYVQGDSDWQNVEDMVKSMWKSERKWKLPLKSGLQYLYFLPL